MLSLFLRMYHTVVFATCNIVAIGRLGYNKVKMAKKQGPLCLQCSVSMIM